MPRRQLLRRLEAAGGGPSTTVYVIVGAAVGVVALLVVAVGVALCRRERRRARALADLEQYVHVAPAPPASQLSPGIAAAKPPPFSGPHATLAVSSGGGSSSFDAAAVPSSYYAVTSPTGLNAHGSYSHVEDVARPSAGIMVQTVALPTSPTLSQRSRSNSFEKHDSYRRFMYGEESVVESEPPISAGKSALWDDPAIQAARIPLDRLEIGRVLSRGGFGEVLDGDYRGQRVAVKRLLPETRREMRHIEQFLSEIRLLATLEHPRIVRFVGVAWEALSDLCAVSEFMVGGDLRSLLSAFDGEGSSTNPQYSRRPRGFDTDKARIALDVAHALTYLHSLEPMVLHRDLKSRNVLLDDQLHAKLTDFGVSRERLGDNSTLTAGVGTLLWMAPEVMMGDRYDYKADMFSFGVLLSELDTQQLPYAHAKVTDTGRTIPDAALLQLVALGELRASFSPASSPGRERLVRLGESCLALEPEQRPTASETLYQLQLAVRECEEEEAAASNPGFGTGMTDSVTSSDVDEHRSYMF